MTEQSKIEYQNLINRLKLPENKELYDKNTLHPNDSKEKIELGCDNSALEEDSLLRLIKEAHQLLDQSGWAKK